jgi:hypothetical protein
VPPGREPADDGGEGESAVRKQSNAARRALQGTECFGNGSVRFEAFEDGEELLLLVLELFGSSESSNWGRRSKTYRLTWLFEIIP